MPSEAVETRIRSRVQKPERYFERTTSCHVWVDAVHASQAPGRQRGRRVSYEIRIELRVLGTELAVSRKPGDVNAHKNIMVAIAIRDSFDAMERQLKEYVARLRGGVKSHVEPLQGRITRLFPEQGYGFVATIDGQEIYFHEHSVVPTDPRRRRCDPCGHSNWRGTPEARHAFGLRSDALKPWPLPNRARVCRARVWREASSGHASLRSSPIVPLSRSLPSLSA
jgi:hypothetical protein